MLNLKSNCAATIFLYSCDTSPVLPDVSINLDLSLSPDKYIFCCKDKDNTKISYDFESVTLLVPTIKLMDKYYLSIQEKLRKAPIRQYFDKTEVRKLSIWH